MRTLAELYKLVLQDLEDSDLNEVEFICNIIKNLNVTDEEKNILKNDFMKNKPSKTQHVDFFNHFMFSGKSSWWEHYITNEVYDPKLANEQRVLFIKHLIQLHEK